jgi:hypothetical protein
MLEKKQIVSLSFFPLPFPFFFPVLPAEDREKNAKENES